MPELATIFEHFQLGGPVAAVAPFGSGNIHATYRSTVQGQARQYIHQHLNTTVFQEPDAVMDNMARVTQHLRRQFARLPDTRRRETLEIVPTHDGALLYVDAEGRFWRTTVCIPDILTRDTIQNVRHAYEVGRTLGEFQRLVADIPSEELHDTLPGFHDTPRYYQEMVTVFATPHPEAEIERRKHDDGVQRLFEQICRYESIVSILVHAQRAGRIRNRVVHNDPKVNNILLDADTQQGIGMIDLDTVKAGLIHFDYGDCLRTAANPAGEETQDVAAVSFDAEIFEAVSRGYLDEVRELLTPDDVELLIDSIKVITLEQTIRFLADYVNGDVYYGSSATRPLRNLNRARVQWALFQDILKQEAALRASVK